ncbi:TPA: cadmium-translocating P-type ATPase [bacterium]|nr:cadmium-translocating P-type ATPase [bacterium]
MFKLSKGKIVLISGILAVISLVLKETIGYELITIILMLAVTIIAGAPIFKKAIGALRFKILGIDALVSIAVIGALIIGEYWEAAAVTFLFMFGDYLEARTIQKTRSSIQSLLKLAPDLARVVRDGVEVEVDPSEVNVNESVIVKPGEKIAVDGIVIQGNAYVNQASITGESISVYKDIDDSVYSGTIIESGYLVIKALKVGEDTTFARILEMVYEAQDKKAKTQKFLERFAKYYTPFIILLAIVFFLITWDIRMALTLLVIACPGALVISAPVSIVAGIGNGAKKGVLFKGGEIIENLNKIKVIAFDKTGTLTKGKPTVETLKTYGISDEELLRLAVIGESYSEHPLGKAIINKGNEVIGQISEQGTDYEIITGKGLKFSYQGVTYYIGNRKLFINNQIDDEQEEYLRNEEDLGRTSVIVGTDSKVIGVISIADVIRDDSRQLIKDLKTKGKKLVMLTGDNERVARYIASQLGIDEYYADLLPEDKVTKLNELKAKYGSVGMVGDGVNDAPALATSDLGIAMGGVGSDVAMETADVVLMSAELKKLSYAIGLSSKTVTNMKQNIIFALVVAGMLLLGVLVELVNLSLGMLVHEASVLLVIINAARLINYGKNKN